jgi:hypothetical protein
MFELRTANNIRHTTLETEMPRLPPFWSGIPVGILDQSGTPIGIPDHPFFIPFWSGIPPFPCAWSGIPLLFPIFDIPPAFLLEMTGFSRPT